MQVEEVPSPWAGIYPSKELITIAIRNILNPVYLETTERLDILQQDFSTGQVIAVSDGSFMKANNGAATAWIIESHCKTQWIMGSIHTPGPTEALSAYRSELTGLAAISVTLRILSQCCPSPPHIIIACDGLSALNVLTTNKDDISANSLNADLQSLIADIWAEIPTRPFPLHVKGHQDETGTTLNRLEQLNIMMDSLARLTALERRPLGVSLSIPPLGLQSVWYKGDRIPGNLYRSLYNKIASDQIWNYFSTKLFSSPQVLPLIHTSAFHRARNTSATSLNIFISKWLSNTLATGLVMQRRQHRVFNRCPRCNHWGEDRLHIVICWDVRATIVWKKQIDTLTNLLHQEYTAPEIQQFLLTGLQEFRKHPRQNSPEPPLWKTETSQIGWLNTISGFLSHSIVQRQDDHYKRLGMLRTGAGWASKLIRQFWHIIHQLWVNHNEILHQKGVIHSISGAALLDIEIEREYDLGCQNLPATLHRWYNMPKDQLLRQSIEYKKGWLLLIKTVKESMQIEEYSIFASSRVQNE
jgi:hypothetical protein